MAGGQLAKTAKNRSRMRNVLISQVFIDGGRIDVARHAGHFEQALQLAGKNEAARFLAIVERLFAEPIAAENQSAAMGVPKGDGEHAVEVREALGSFVLVKMDDGFRVAVGPELVPRPFQAMAEGLVVVGLAIEDDPH